jgi:ribonuclease HI
MTNSINISEAIADGDLTTMMGAAFVVADEEDLHFATALRDWPSSTRAELAAIFYALLTAPRDATAIINMDSSCAISSIFSL